VVSAGSVGGFCSSFVGSAESVRRFPLGWDRVIVLPKVQEPVTLPPVSCQPISTGLVFLTFYIETSTRPKHPPWRQSEAGSSLRKRGLVVPLCRLIRPAHPRRHENKYGWITLGVSDMPTPRQSSTCRLVIHYGIALASRTVFDTFRHEGLPMIPNGHRNTCSPWLAGGRSRS
jgi:hypothetical protein